MKSLLIVILIFVGMVYGVGFFTDVALNKVSFEEYNRRFFYQTERYLEEQRRTFTRFWNETRRNFR